MALPSGRGLLSGALRLLLCVLALLVTEAKAGAPQRIVSANLCADRLVVALADPEHIVSLSYHSADPLLSTITERAASLPLNHGDAEEILALHPDLVIFGRYSSKAAADMLSRLGIPIFLLGVPKDLAGMRQNIRDMAKILGVPERGEAMIAAIDVRLAAILRPHKPVRAIIYSAGGWTHGADSIDEDVLTLVGAQNIASRAGIDGVGTLSLEELIAQSPQMVIIENNGRGQHSLAAQLLEHPVLRGDNLIRLEMPMTLWECIDGSITDAVAKIEDALP